MYLTQLLHRHRQRRPAVTALVCGSSRRTYAQLFDHVARMAAGLQELGVGRGDRVGLLSQHSLECVELMFACWWSGAVFCPVNTRWSEAEIVDSLRDCSPSVLVADAAYFAVAESVRAQIDSVLELVRLDASPDAAPDSYPTLARGPEPAEDQRAAADTLAALIYTGGTTGRSKGVMLSHGGLSAGAVGRLADLGPLEGSVALITTPNFHVASLIRVLTHLIAGSTCVILPQFRAEEGLDLIERERVTDLPVVPTMLQMMLDHPQFRPERLRSVLRVSYGAAPSAGALLQRAQAALPWVGLHQFYGMTESSGVATMSLPSDHDPQGWVSGRAISAGRASTLVELRVVDDGDNDLPPGQVGEIVLRGPLLSTGYWNRPEETARTFRDGWLHTGDAGRLDGDGYLYVVDRIKDMIVTGGENVYSAEVEGALALHPAVSTAAVIGIPSERWGEAVHAFVVLKDGAASDEASIKAHCRQLVADYKVPKSIEFAPALPLTPAGKVAKNVLREKYWQGHDRRVN